MDPNQFAIRGYLSTNGITPEIKRDLYKKKKCQTSAALPPQPQREFQPIPPPEEPWYHCGIDLVRLYRTTQEFLHIVVIVCCLTKFVIARPLRTNTSRRILGCLQEIYFTSKIFPI